MLNEMEQVCAIDGRIAEPIAGPVSVSKLAAAAYSMDSAEPTRSRKAGGAELTCCD